MTLESMTRACAAWARCTLDEPENAGQVDGPLAVSLCLHSLKWSSERAIPISPLPLSPFESANERVEFFVDCAIAATDCETLAGCITKREIDMYCEEDGCRANTEYQVACEGTLATLTPTDGAAVQRDCARALAVCDPESPTGCSDRHFSACPEPPPQPDRCDGDVRLGCDGMQQVSYRDCARMGGSCAPETSDCVYGHEACESSASCEGEQLSICLGGARIAIDAPELCAAEQSP